MWLDLFRPNSTLDSFGTFGVRLIENAVGDAIHVLQQELTGALALGGLIGDADQVQQASVFVRGGRIIRLDEIFDSLEDVLADTVTVLTVLFSRTAVCLLLDI